MAEKKEELFAAKELTFSVFTPKEKEETLQLL